MIRAKKVQFRLSLVMLLGFLTASLTASQALADFQNELVLGPEALSLVGSGSRKKAFIRVYDAALYISGSEASAEKIVANDEAMAVSIKITSRLISAKRLSAALREGFDRATGGDTAPIEAEIDSFQSAFASPVGKGDRFDLVYVPASGLQVFRNGQPDVLVAGLAFKQALFAIWLGPDPVQESLKQAMLAQ